MSFVRGRSSRPTAAALPPTQISSDPRTPLDSLVVARRIYGRDPDLRRNDAGEVRRHLGALSLDAAYALSEVERGRALRLLLSSLFAYRTFNAKTLRTLFKSVLNNGLVRQSGAFC